MRSVFERQADDARAIERQIRQGTAKIVSAGNFGRVAKLLWPLKTAAYIASVARADERTAARWLSGEFEPPVAVVLHTMDEIFKRE
jgi:hypothetical protein